jgi:drug/metabolite transporter (DMT)-like permease
LNVWLALFLTVLSWAATFHLARQVVGQMAPLGAIIWRFALAAAFLIPLVSLRERWQWLALWRHRWVLLFLGGIGITGFQLGMFYGLRTSTATNASLLMGFSPALTVALSAVLERRWIGARQFAGLILGTVGVITVVCRGQWSVLQQLDFSGGDLLLVAGGGAWALYSVVLQRWVSGVSLLQVTVATIVICTLLTLTVAVATSPGTVRWPPPHVWPALLVMGVAGSALAYVWWNDAVARVGASRAAQFMNLVPVLTMLMAVPLGEPLALAQVLGAVLVITGVLLATQRDPADR